MFTQLGVFNQWLKGVRRVRWVILVKGNALWVFNEKVNANDAELVLAGR